MYNSKENQYLAVETSSLNINTIAEQFTNPDFKKQILNSNIILLPYIGFMDYEQLLFTDLTRELYRYLKTQQSDSIIVEVAYEGDQPNELIQHADFLDLGKIFIFSFIAPIALSLLSNFIYDKINNSSKCLDNSIVRCEIIVNKQEDNSKVFKYDGPASSFEKLLESQILSDFDKI